MLFNSVAAALLCLPKDQLLHPRDLGFGDLKGSLTLSLLSEERHMPLWANSGFMHQHTREKLSKGKKRRQGQLPWSWAPGASRDGLATLPLAAKLPTHGAATG